MRQGQLTNLNFLELEDRFCPSSFNLFSDGLGNVTIASDTSGAISVVASAPGLIDVFSSVPPASANLVFDDLPVLGNLTLRTGGLNDNIAVVLNPGASINGDLTIDSGIGTDSVLLGGDAGSTIGGNVSLRNANTVSVSGTGVFSIGGSILVNSFQENDNSSFTLSNVFVGRDVSVQTGNGGDIVMLSGSVIGGSASAFLGNALTSQSFMLDGSSVGGRLSVLTGNGDADAITLTAASVGGPAYVNMFNGFGTNQFSFDADSSIGGSLVLLGGSGTDQVNTFEGILAGNFYANLGGGQNDLDFTGSSLFGTSISYFGGAGDDGILFEPATISQARLFASLGAGADSVALNTSGLQGLFLDFGAGSDTFTQTVPLPLFAVVFNV
ncbi:MAG: hypothetical protein ACFCD0_21665 [Gemmataceae bacterium]